MSDFAPAPDDYLWRVAQIESGGNPGAWTQGSKYRGLYQLGPDEEQRYGVTDWQNQDQQRRALSGIYGANKSYFNKATGRDPTDAESYLMHQQGPAGALRLLQNPDVSAASLNGHREIAGNLPASWGLDPATITGRQFADAWAARYNRTGVGSAPRPPADIPNTPRTPMADATQDQGALAQPTRQSLSVWDSMGPALEKAALYLMGPQTAVHASAIDERQKQQWVKTGTDMLGSEHYGMFNPYTGRVTAPGQTVNTAGGPAMAGVNAVQSDPAYALQRIQQLRQSGVTDPAELSKYVPSEIRDIVSGMSNYTLDPKTLGTRQKLMGPAGAFTAAVNPGWDGTNYDERHKFASQYATANNSNQILAGYKTLGHVETMAKGVADAHLSDTGNNMTAGVINDVHGFFDKDWAAKRAKYMEAAAPLAGESMKLFGGNTAAAHERDRWVNQLAGARSATEAQAAIEGLRDLIMSQMGDLRDHRNSVFSNVSPEDLDKRFPLYNATDRLGKINGYLAQIKPTPAARAAAGGASAAPSGSGRIIMNPQTGQRLIETPNGWQPL